MIRVQLFASVREALGTSTTELSPAGIVEVNDVLQKLVAEHGELWEQILLQEKVLMAVNQEIANRHTAVKDGDEVAFFPPVTGG